MTDLLVRLGQPMTVIEGAAPFALRLRNATLTSKWSMRFLRTMHRGRNLKASFLVMCSSTSKIPSIFSRAREWLTDTGRILVAVPNARSLHRQAAVIMGMLSFEEQLDEFDIHHGHRRVYNPETFRRDFIQAGLTIEIFGGYWLKPLSNGQIERDWDEKLLHGFMILGERYPDIAGEIYVVAKR